MIRYPNEDRLPPAARDNVDRFKRSSIAAELESETETWSLDNWPWFDEPPHRFVFRNEQHEGKEVTFRAGGSWTVNNIDESPKIRPQNLAIKA